MMKKSKIRRQCQNRNHCFLNLLLKLNSEAENLKSMPITERKLDVTLKAQALTNFNTRLSDTIRESKQLMSQSTKLKSLNSIDADKQFEIRSELNPVTIDTTAAVSYILNMTLADQSIVKKTDIAQNEENKEEKISEKSIPPLANKEPEIPQPNNPLEMSPSKSQNHAFSVENMNIMKHRQTNKTKTTDIDKKVPSNVSDQNNEIAVIPKEPPKPRKKYVEVKPINEEFKGLYCIGDLPFYLFYHCKSKVWSKTDFAEESAYKGGLKYPCAVRMDKQDIIIFTGGCDNYTGEASNCAFKANITKISLFEAITSMTFKRYGHCSISVGNTVYVIGGFDHQDTETTSPSTLMSCEKYDLNSNMWINCGNLIHPVAFAAICNVNDHFYLFGGFEDYNTVDVIQRYNSKSDEWELLNTNLPVKLAKMGAANVENEEILIVGGIFEDSNSDNPLSLINNTYKLQIKHMKWGRASPMRNRRTLNSTLYSFENQFYVVGSSTQGSCEKYDPEVNKWINIASYEHILSNNDLQSFSVFMYD